ncbi:hypothetical protein [Helicobacter pylori]|uniref:hypothetical protein n=1 Tax=Helicobacter pylori TaxID=210 RepID=UPI00165CEBAD|nr:hypothetical protein [Helicobacter pylori]
MKNLLLLSLLLKNTLTATPINTLAPSDNNYKNHIILAYSDDEAYETMTGPVAKCYLFSDTIPEARRCVRENVSDPKLARHSILMAEALNSCLNLQQTPETYIACMKRNVKDPELIDMIETYVKQHHIEEEEEEE